MANKKLSSETKFGFLLRLVRAPRRRRDPIFTRPFLKLWPLLKTRTVAKTEADDGSQGRGVEVEVDNSFLVSNTVIVVTWSRKARSKQNNNNKP